ncbi:MAG: hypothetical protein JWP29_3551 [Rhodoferax sp.]|nr:hypothetical protein [Rhodoferax sp.]
MLTPADLLTLFAPELADKSAGNIAAALYLGSLETAAWDMPQHKIDEATALYAAWVLSAQGIGGVAGSTSSTTGPTAGGVLILEKEGDLTRQYSPATGGTTSTSTSSAVTANSGNYKARYDAIARLMGYGAILARTPRPALGSCRLSSFPWL